jgi:hypothetical protein
MRKELINEFNNIKQLEFGYLKSLVLEREFENDRYECTLKIVLSKIPFDRKELNLVFYDVRDLKIGHLEGLFKLFIDIRDVSADCLEGINYRVCENEENIFSFYCKSFEFNIT